MTHPADTLTDRAAEVLRGAGHAVEHDAVARATRRWWAFSRPQRVPLGYALGHFLPLAHDTVSALDALGAEADAATSTGGGAHV
ncbi:hypothetical protein [Kytococcus schroeteri]|uniref:hypothetical protein n=1 Tax=Kytococcus schroeteri TaxID=138300 RepID=UPI001143FEB1|nr:hypothetical protein [Kytococcus schroeteri]